MSEPIDTGRDDSNDRYIVPALERGLRLLGEFSRDNRRLGAPELARRLGLPRSTIFRLLSTLESLGFIERTEGGSEYRLGIAVLRLGFEYLASLELTELGQPVLERLCAEVRFPCQLAVRDGRSIVYVAKATPPTPLTGWVRVGTRLPAHATVLGHALLQDMSLSELRRLFPEEHLESFSSSTPRSVLELFDTVERGRERGYVMGEGSFEPGVSSIGAPVRDHTSRIVAALGVVVSSSRIEPNRVDELTSLITGAAAELSFRLNYSPERARAGTVTPLHPRGAK